MSDFKPDHGPRSREQRDVIRVIYSEHREKKLIFVIIFIHLLFTNLFYLSNNFRIYFSESFYLFKVEFRFRDKYFTLRLLVGSRLFLYYCLQGISFKNMVLYRVRSQLVPYGKCDPVSTMNISTINSTIMDSKKGNTFRLLAVKHRCIGAVFAVAPMGPAESA